MQSNSYNFINTCSLLGLATQIATGPTTLKRIIVNDSTTSYTIGIVDGTSGSTINVGQITTIATSGTPTRNYDCRLANGLRIITTGKYTILPSITVVYNQ